MSDALSLPRKKKLIELPEDTLKRLSFMAIPEGKSLRAFIENLLITEAKTTNDEDLYRHLVEIHPKDKVYLSDKEKGDFEKSLGIWTLDTLSLPKLG